MTHPPTLGKWLAALGAVCLLVATSWVALTATPAGAVPAVQTRLLTLADMPNGWRGGTATGGSTAANDAITLGSCLALTRKLPKGGVEASAIFSGPQGFPAFAEQLASGPKGRAFYTSLVRGLSKCKTLTARTGTRTMTGTVSRLRFPRVGKASKAFTVTTTATHITVDLDIVLFRTEHSVGFTGYVSLGSPAAATRRTFVALTRKAVRRAG